MLTEPVIQLWFSYLETPGLATESPRHPKFNCHLKGFLLQFESSLYLYVGYLAACLHNYRHYNYRRVTMLCANCVSDTETESINLNSNPFTRQELVSMVSSLRDACLGVVYLAIPDSRPVFEDRKRFLAELGIQATTERTITKESYAKQRSEWIYLFNVSDTLML